MTADQATAEFTTTTTTHTVMSVKLDTGCKEMK